MLNVPINHLHYRYIKGSVCEQNISTQQYLYVHILGEIEGYRGGGAGVYGGRGDGGEGWLWVHTNYWRSMKNLLGFSVCKLYIV